MLIDLVLQKHLHPYNDSFQFQNYYSDVYGLKNKTSNRRKNSLKFNSIQDCTTNTAKQVNAINTQHVYLKKLYPRITCEYRFIIMLLCDVYIYIMYNVYINDIYYQMILTRKVTYTYLTISRFGFTRMTYLHVLYFKR